jgi:stearoyl-CoA desaturase (delta-9 desaturase)
MTDQAQSSPSDDGHDDIIYPSTIPFIIVHLACVLAIFTGVTWEAVGIAVGLYWLRMFAIGAGYHRLFSHKAYETSRVFQFILAFLCQTTAQKSVLWWAGKHRHHHLHSDTEHDVHSPRQSGFFMAHVGWIFTPRHGETDFRKVEDLARYPELVWLHRMELLPATLTALACFLAAGWPGLIVGFCWSTVAVWHGTFCINSLAHVHGTKRYVTGDDSRNNWLLALMTMGEGWHNNHHAYQSSVRQGFRWWEFDPTFYILLGLSKLGIVWNLKYPPEALLRNEQPLGSRVVERAATQLAESYNLDTISKAVAEAIATTPSLSDLRHSLAQAQTRAADVLAGVQLPHIPTRAEVLAQAEQLFVATRSLDRIADRAYGIILERVGQRLAATHG